MNLLLDTHAFLWAIADDPRLSQSAREAFLDPANALYLSMASAWEIAIKKSLGKLKLSGRWQSWLAREMTRNGIAWLPIEFPHCVKVASLRFHHRDPFDRLIAAQALLERHAILSADAIFDRYGIRRIW